MKLNSPIPQSLPNECSKAARIFKSFVDGSNNGLDGVIPRSVLENARGFAIFTIFKAGFLFSARAGSGIVIAKLQDGRWSSPSAIGTAGLGVGGQAGAEMTDFLIVLNTRSAIQTFMAAGSLTLGGNLSIALGPLGRNGEAIGSLNTSGKVAAMYSYSKTRGLFGGISVEGSVIAERQDANRQAYRSPVTSRMLLGGAVDPPEWTSYLIQTLESCTGLPGGRRWIQDGQADGTYAFGPAVAISSAERNTSHLTKTKKKSNTSRQRESSGEYPRDTSHDTSKDSGFYFESGNHITQTQHGRRVMDWDRDIPSSSPSDYPFESNVNPARPRFNQSISYTPLDMSYDNPAHISHHSRPFSPATLPPSELPLSNPSSIPRGHGLSTARYDSGATRQWTHEASQEDPPCAIALYDFNAVESGDLSFSKGDVIVILKMSDSSDDWWTGKCRGRQGIFPANRVEVI